MKTLIRPESTTTSEQPAPFKDGSPNLVTNMLVRGSSSGQPLVFYVVADGGVRTAGEVSTSLSQGMSWSMPQMLTCSLQDCEATNQESLLSPEAISEWGVSELVARNTVNAVRVMTPWAGMPDITVTEGATILLDWETSEAFATAEVGSTTFGLLISANGKPTLMKNGPVEELGFLGPAVATALDLNPRHRALWSWSA